MKADDRLGMSGNYRGCMPAVRHARNTQKKSKCAVSGMYEALRRESPRTRGNEPARADRERSLRKQTAVCSTGTAAGAPFGHESTFINW